MHWKFLTVSTIISIVLLLTGCIEAQNQPYNPSGENILNSAMTRIEHLLRNDELECLPRLLCEYAAGGKPGQGKAVNVDIKSLFTLLQYLGLNQNSNSSPMLSFTKAATLGYSHRGDSYECYRSYPRCPRDEGRLLYYLNNHRGGFFRGFEGYYNRNSDKSYKNVAPGESDARIVNNKYSSNIEALPFPPYANDFGYSPNQVFASIKPEFVFSNEHRRPKGIDINDVTDRLPSRLHFPTEHNYEGSIPLFVNSNDIGGSFFPQN